MFLQTKNISAETKNYLLNVYNKYPVNISHGIGSKLYDSDGNEYIDFLSGIAVTNFGHNNSSIKEKVLQQLDELWHVSNLFEIEGQQKLASKLCDLTGLSGVFFTNSGTEAIEAAIKFTRLWGGERFEIITAIDSFHGRSMGSLSATGQFNLWKDFKPILPGFKYVPFNDLNALENNITEFTCAIMLETIQGEGGIKMPSDDYFENVQQICKNNNLLLIIDEIQTGIGRTGKHFAYQHYGITPDIVTSAKALANGLPLGATICSERVASAIKPGCHGSTFGGNPVAVAAANAVLSLLNEDALEKINFTGDYLIAKLNSLNLDPILEIRGKGLMIGIEFNDNIDAKEVVNLLLENNIITCTAKGNVLRLLPPFIITESQIDEFADKLKYVCNTLTK